jgi:hypothetical protein
MGVRPPPGTTLSVANPTNYAALISFIPLCFFVRPLIGRVFTEDEDLNNVQVVVISYALWQRRYGGPSEVLGRTISIMMFHMK